MENRSYKASQQGHSLLVQIEFRPSHLDSSRIATLMSHQYTILCVWSIRSAHQEFCTPAKFPFINNFMKTNDQLASAKTTHLLEWMGNLVQYPISHLPISQIFEQRCLISVMAIIDHQYFQCLNQLDSPNFLDLLILIEDYIEHVLKRQFKRRLWNDILKKKSFLQLLSLIAYVAVHSPNKNKFIPAILQLATRAQNSIKEAIEQISSWIQNQYSIDTKEMLNKIDDLESQNESLREEVARYQASISQLEERYRCLENDYYFVQNQCLSLKEEKSHVCRQLQLNVYDDLVEKYRLLQQDLEEAYEEIKYDQGKIRELETDKQDCKARIIGDGELIQELNEELKTARGICKSLRLSTGLQSPTYMSQPIFTQRLQKENIPLLNLPAREADDVCAHRKKLYNFLNNNEQQLEDEVLRLKAAVEQLQQQNVHLNEQILCLREENESYKQNSRKLRYTNRERKYKLMQLQSLYRQFKQQVLSN